MSFYPRLILLLIVLLLAAEVSAEAVNWLLVLILAGVLLMRWKSFSQLIQYIGQIGG